MFDCETSEYAEQTRKYYGKYLGKVLENTASKDANHRGELLVEVWGILEETPDGSGKGGLQVMATPSFPPGFFFIPDVHAHVWVEFIAGEIESPVWTGVWYPNDAAPKTAEDQAPTEFQKIVRTSSGHVIQLDDKGGNIVIKHQGGAKIELTGNTVNIKGDTNITVNIKGDTNIDGVLTVGSGPKTIIEGNEIKGV